MITIRAKECYTPLCYFTGDFSHIKTEFTESGKAIATEFKTFSRNNPNVAIYRYVIMPDHIHFIIHVVAKSEKGLSDIVSSFMGCCSRRYWGSHPEDTLSEDKIGLFEKCFHDRILLHREQLNAMKKYVEDNPRRLFIRRTHSEYFNHVITIRVRGKLHSVYGNIFLLRNPVKMAVVVSRKYSAGQLRELRQQWAETARQGGVLIGAFVSKAEQEVKEMGIKAGASVIEIQPNGFTERYSPGPKNLEICAQGRLLEIGLNPYSTRSEVFDRELCLAMNAFARSLAEISPDDILMVKR
jgi:REP element-mobilizing transposase RayT